MRCAVWYVALLSSVQLAFCEFEADFQADASLNGEMIRQAIFNNPGFSKVMPPTSDRKAAGTTYSAAGTDVSMQLRFFKVQVVNAAEGWMRLKIWLRMSWQDQRLSWNPADFNGQHFTYFQGDNFGGSEISEIWIPDIQHYNANSGLVMTMEPSAVRVNYKGEAFLSRPGSLDVMCKFSGLGARARACSLPAEPIADEFTTPCTPP